MSQLPPGPRDNFLGFRLGDRIRRKPLQFFNELVREYGDLAMFRVGPYRFCLVNHPDLIREVLVTQRTAFPKMARHLKTISSFSGNNLFVSDGELWKRQRRLVQPAFRTQRFAGYGKATTDHANRLADSWSDGDQFDLVPRMAQLALLSIGQALFNLDLSSERELYGKVLQVHSETLRDEFRAAVVLPDWLPLEKKRRKRWAMSQLRELISGVIQDRRDSGRDQGDVLSMLLAAVDEEGDGGQMTDQQALHEASIMLIAGQDDVTAALSWIWFLLATHPEVEQRFRDELKAVLNGRTPTSADVAQLPYTEMVIKETLRMYPPTWALVPRDAARTVQLGGFRIPKRSWIFVSPYATHHDARFYPDPERFDPERFSPDRQGELSPFTYLPFGAGPRMCIGNHFSMSLLTLAVTTIAQRFHIRVLDDPATVTPDPSLALRPRNGINVKLVAV